MTKLFASDYDGTLHPWNTDEPVSDETLAAIRAFQQEGGLFGVCTGRPLHALTMQTWDVIPFDFYIASSGACIFDRNLSPIQVNVLSHDVAWALCQELQPFATDGRTLICCDNDYWTLQPPSGSLAHILKYATSFDELPRPLMGVSLPTDTEELAAEATDLVNTRFADYAVAYQNLASLDIVPVGCSKGTGLRTTAAHFGATVTAGMGDSFNDLPLLEATDRSYAFGFCDPQVQTAATMVVDTPGEAIDDFAAC